MQANRQSETVAGGVLSRLSKRTAPRPSCDPSAVLGAVEAESERDRLEWLIQ